MNKFSKLAFIAATIVVVSSASAKSAPRSVPVSQQAVNDNWADGTGELIWTNGTNELCWRNGFWTPATANAKCDGALVAEAPPASPVVPTLPAPAPIASQKVRYQAETLFDFDSAALKPEGKAELDKLVEKLRNVNIEVFVTTGHTDRIGTDSYNDRLGWRRAQAVKSYLANKGIRPELIYTESKGKREPVKTDCRQSLRKERAALIACLAPNRRVEIEVVGTVIPADLPSRSDPPLSDDEVQSQQ